MTRGLNQPHGIVGRYGVEIGSRDIAMLGELAFIPSGAGDPFAGLEQRNLGLYTSYNLSH